MYDATDDPYTEERLPKRREECDRGRPAALLPQVANASLKARRRGALSMAMMARRWLT